MCCGSYLEDILILIDLDHLEFHFHPLLPSLGILSCGGLMIYKSAQAGSSALLFPVWLWNWCGNLLTIWIYQNRNNENRIHKELVHGKILNRK